MRGVFKVELLSQSNDGKYTHFTIFDIHVPSNHTDRVTKGDMAPAAWGTTTLMSHKDIFNSDYLKYDSLYFMISYQPFSVSQQNDEHVAPVIFKIRNFTEKMKNNQVWYSDPFFAFWRGYKMCLRVDAGGNGDGKDTHVSVFLHLMKGPYDDELEQSGHWPLRGKFKIEILDQINFDNHAYSLTFNSDVTRNISDRVIEKFRNKAPDTWGYSQFISHKAILDSNYLKHDSLYFMISYQGNET